MRIWTRLHKLLAIIVGLQVLLWIAGGLYMSAVPLQWVHGKPLLHDEQVGGLPPPLILREPAGNGNISLVLSDYKSVSWIQSPGGWLLQTKGFDAETRFWQITPAGLQLALAANETLIRTYAAGRYAGNGEIARVQFLDVPPEEASGIDFSIVAVSFDDWLNTTFYMHPISAQVLTVRSDLWRLFDIFWMLHIMDYESRSDFNNPLLITSAVVALGFTITGMALVWYWLRREIRRKLIKRRWILEKNAS